MAFLFLFCCVVYNYKREIIEFSKLSIFFKQIKLYVFFKPPQKFIANCFSIVFDTFVLCRPGKTLKKKIGPGAHKKMRKASPRYKKKGGGGQE